MSNKKKPKKKKSPNRNFPTTPIKEQKDAESIATAIDSLYKKSKSKLDNFTFNDACPICNAASLMLRLNCEILNKSKILMLSKSNQSQESEKAFLASQELLLETLEMANAITTNMDVEIHMKNGRDAICTPETDPGAPKVFLYP